MWRRRGEEEGEGEEIKTKKRESRGGWKGVREGAEGNRER